MEKSNRPEEKRRKLKLVEKYDNDDYSRFAGPDFREDGEFEIGEQNFSQSPHHDKDRIQRKSEGNWHHPGVSGKSQSGDTWVNDKEYHDQVDFVGYGPKSYTRSDDRIYEEVCEALMKHREVDATNIGVLVDHGIVHLTGRVQTKKMKNIAEFVSEDLPGVKAVRNELTVIRGVETENGPDAATKKDLGLS